MKRTSVTAILAGAALLLAACASATPPSSTSGARAVTSTDLAAQVSATSSISCAGLPPASTGYPSPDTPLAAVDFASAQHGWAVGAGRIIATTNGGQHWTTQYKGKAQLDQVDFVGTGYGWAVGQATLLKTTNGGRTWTSVTDPCDAIRSVNFVTTRLGYAVFGGTQVLVPGGTPVPVLGGKLLRTQDGGHTWQVVGGTPASVQDACFNTPDVGFLAALGRVYRTANAGRTWSVTLTPPGAGYASSPSTTTVACAGKDAAWAYVIGFGAAAGSRGYIAYEAQNGRNWHALFENLYRLPGTPDGPGSYPGPYSAISATSAAFVGWTPAVGFGQANLDTVASATKLTGHGAVRGLTLPLSTAFVSAARGWVIGVDQSPPLGQASTVIEATSNAGHTWTRQYAVS